MSDNSIQICHQFLFKQPTTKSMREANVNTEICFRDVTHSLTHSLFADEMTLQRTNARTRACDTRDKDGAMPPPCNDRDASNEM
eukprot:m.116841 g.116841  ORF g.116841 m.116841 type:complete len:84 (+) comp9311_c0_seq1:1833-2084(+)